MCALLQFGDLIVLHRDLAAEKFIRALQQFDDAIVGRDMPR